MQHFWELALVQFLQMMTTSSLRKTFPTIIVPAVPPKKTNPAVLLKNPKKNASANLAILGMAQPQKLLLAETGQSSVLISF